MANIDFSSRFKNHGLSNDTMIYEQNDETKKDEKEDNKEEKDVEVEVTETTEEVSVEDDLSGFGSDDSNVQNQVDPEEIKMINDMIADESYAITRYFDAAKNTNIDINRRLYSDIGAEESFHLEQLLFAKAEMTGEEYEPRQKDVKKEYEELREMGMDAETAAYTAIDKVSTNGGDDETDTDVEELEQECALIVEYLTLDNLITNTVYEEFDASALSKATQTFMEAYIFQEETGNVSEAPRDVQKIQNPVKLLSKGFLKAIQGLNRLSKIIREYHTRNKVKMHRKMEWIKNHGISDLFKSGIGMFFYNDKLGKIDLDTPAQYIDLMYRLAKDIANAAGLRLNENAQHKTITIPRPIKYRNVQEGLNILHGVVMTKTKIVITEHNKKSLESQLFGYNEEKTDVFIKDKQSGNVVNPSNNIFTQLETMTSIAEIYGKVALSVLEGIEQIQGDPNGIYYKDRKKYNLLVEAIQQVCRSYKDFIGALGHDMQIVLKLNNGVLEQTRQHDSADTNHTGYNGETTHVPDATNTTNTAGNTEYTSKKTGLFNKR